MGDIIKHRDTIYSWEAAICTYTLFDVAINMISSI